MYKDKEKQREANRKAQAKFKAKQGITNKPPSGITSQGITDKALPLCPYCLKRPILSDNAIACEECSQMTLVNPKRGKDIKCFADLPLDVQQTIDHICIERARVGLPDDRASRISRAVDYQRLYPDVDNEGKDRAYRHISPMCTIDMGFHVPVTGKPGDADYNGIVTPEWRAERGR